MSSALPCDESSLAAVNRKRSAFRLRKWYFDFLSPELDYCFVYFADVSFFGTTFRSLTTHIARQVGGLRTTRSIPVSNPLEQLDGRAGRSFRFSSGKISIATDACVIDVAGPGCSVQLKYSPHGSHHPQPVLIRKGSRGQILWTPVHMKCTVGGSVNIDDETIEVRECNGYVDYLESSCLPHAVPIRSVYWGRLHHEDFDLVYMHAAGGAETTIGSRLSLHLGEFVRECGDVSIKAINDRSGSNQLSSAGYEAVAATGSCRVRLNIRHALALQESSFIDHQQLMWRSARYLLKKLTRDPRSTKWLSYADVVLEEGETTREWHNIPLIDEFALL